MFVFLKLYHGSKWEITTFLFIHILIPGSPGCFSMEYNSCWLYYEISWWSKEYIEWFSLHWYFHNAFTLYEFRSCNIYRIWTWIRLFNGCNFSCCRSNQCESNRTTCRINQISISCCYISARCNWSNNWHRTTSTHPGKLIDCLLDAICWKSARCIAISYLECLLVWCRNTDRNRSIYCVNIQCKRNRDSFIWIWWFCFCESSWNCRRGIQYLSFDPSFCTSCRVNTSNLSKCRDETILTVQYILCCNSKRVHGRNCTVRDVFCDCHDSTRSQRSICIYNRTIWNGWSSLIFSSPI